MPEENSTDKVPPSNGSGRKPGAKHRFVSARAGRGVRWMKIVVAMLATMSLLFSALVFVAYIKMDVPTPDQFRNDQTSVIYYSDGDTELARVGAENRTDVSLDAVPEHVRNAVLAAENRGFYADPGVSFTGALRAVWNNLTGGDTQGGSTITQQYVKIAFLTSERTFARKFQEILLALKMDNQFSKDQILEWYLNAIYYGRGAYGIQPAAETYFDKDVEKLTVAEGAVLASSIRSPALYDPTNHPDAATERFDYVLDGMVEEGWLSRRMRGEQAYPGVLPPPLSGGAQASGPTGLILNQVRDEMVSIGFDESRLYRDGLRVTTTIDATAQRVAIASVSAGLAGQPENLRSALVSVDPATGAVVAYYGGAVGTGFDYAQAYRQPGTVFQPFTLAAAVERGIGIESVRPSSPDERAAGSCRQCPLYEAKTESVRSVFAGLAAEMGGAAVADLAHRAGIAAEAADGTPTLAQDGETSSLIGLGVYEVRPIDLAHAFATFAGSGIERRNFFISQITDAQGNVLYAKDGSTGTPVIAPEVVNDVSFAMLEAAYVNNRMLDDGRQVACKPGATRLNEQANKDAWMVGYNRQLATVVWMGSEANAPLLDAAGRPIFGADLPGRIWQDYMNGALPAAEDLPMPDHVEVGGDAGPPLESDSDPSGDPGRGPDPPASADPVSTPPP